MHLLRASGSSIKGCARRRLAQQEARRGNKEQPKPAQNPP
jgi:hypothetical protein